jgi:hypothetical protein
MFIRHFSLVIAVASIVFCGALASPSPIAQSVSATQA